jgi:hypothetical protein
MGGGDSVQGTQKQVYALDMVPTSNPQVIEAMIWIAILMLLISRKIYRVVRSLNPEAKMARFTTLRWSNIFTENASSILAGVLHTSSYRIRNFLNNIYRNWFQ